jgi:hypothetical protein
MPAVSIWVKLPAHLGSSSAGQCPRGGAQGGLQLSGQHDTAATRTELKVEDAMGNHHDVLRIWGLTVGFFQDRFNELVNSGR